MSELPKTADYRVKRRPETPEDAVALFQALYDIGGLPFHANMPERVARLDANPMLERVAR